MRVHCRDGGRKECGKRSTITEGSLIARQPKPLQISQQAKAKDMNSRQTATVALLLAVRATSDKSCSVAAAVPDAAATAATTLCEEKYYLDKMTEHLKAKINSRTSRLGTNELAAAKFRLAAAVAETKEQQCLMTALEAKARGLQNKVLKKAQKAPSELTQALELVNQQMGMLLLAVESSKNTFAVPATSTHGTTAATSTMIALTAGPAAQATCDLQAAATAGTIGGHTPNPAAAKDIKLSSLKKTAALQTPIGVTISGITSCDGNGDANQALGTALNACNWAGATGSVQTKAATYAELAPSSTRIYKADGDRSQCEQHSNSNGTPITREQALANSLCAALEAKDPDEAIPELSGTTLAADEVIQEAVASCTDKFAHLKSKTDISGSSDLKEYITQAYGKTASDFESKFKAVLKTKQVPVRDGNTIQQKAIDEITLDDDTNAALTRLLQIRAAKAQREPGSGIQTDSADKTEEKKDGDNKTTAGECKATEEDKCDKTKCDWNAEKNECKVKEGAAVISAVIKVPFLFLQLFLEDFLSNL